MRRGRKGLSRALGKASSRDSQARKGKNSDVKQKTPKTKKKTTPTKKTNPKELVIERGGQGRVKKNTNQEGEGRALSAEGIGDSYSARV